MQPDFLATALARTQHSVDDVVTSLEYGAQLIYHR